MPTWINDIDLEVLNWFQTQRTDWLNYNVSNFTALGSTTVLAVVVVIALGFLLLYGQCRKVFLVAVIVVGAFYATEGIKTAVARPRPTLGVNAKPRAPRSFPSSHSSLSMTVFMVLALCLRRPSRTVARTRAYPCALAWAFLLAVVVGISRLYLGVHHLSDVLAGLLLGLVFALLFYLADRLTGPAPEVPLAVKPV